jgi:hypothetical protein
MGRTTIDPAVQSASASAVGGASSVTDTDEISSGETGSQDNVNLSVTGSVTVTDTTANSKLQYTTDGGTNWSDLVTQGVVGSQSDTYTAGLGTVNLANLKVRAYAFAAGGLFAGASSSAITAWSFSYLTAKTTIIIEDEG